jgi:undecaprenyl-diphosphatase
MGQNGRMLEFTLGALAILMLLATAAITAWWLADHPALVRPWGRRLLQRSGVRWLTDRYGRRLTSLAGRLTPHAAFALSSAVGLIVIVAAGWAFGELAEGVHQRDDLAVHDGAVSAWLAEHRIGWLTSVLSVVTWLGSGWITVPLILLAAPLLARPGRRRRTTVIAVIVVAGTHVLVQSIKFLMARPRPVLQEVIATAEGFAFPSGHSAQAVAVYGTLAYLACRRPLRWRHRVHASTVAVVLILLIGFSRLYLGVHWLTDVVGGFVLAGLWLAVVLTGANAIGELGRHRAARAKNGVRASTDRPTPNPAG